MSGTTTKVLATALLIGAVGSGIFSSASYGAISSSQPVDITANEAEVQQDNKLAIWRGEVEALQGANRLRTPELTVYYSGGQTAAGGGGGGMGSIQRMEAKGPVYLVTPTQTAKGDRGVYLAADDTFTLTGNVVLMQEKNVVRGERLVVNQTTGQSTLYASAAGRGGSGRVRGVFYPNQTSRQNNAPSSPSQASPAPAAPPAAR